MISTVVSFFIGLVILDAHVVTIQTEKDLKNGIKKEVVIKTTTTHKGAKGNWVINK